MRFFSSLVRPDESTGAVMRWVHRIWVFFWLTALGAGIGLLAGLHAGAGRDDLEGSRSGILF